MKSIKVRLRKKRGRGWVYQDIEIPTDEEMERIAAELHAKHEPALINVLGWKVLYNPGKVSKYAMQRVDPFTGIAMGDKEEKQTKRPSYCVFGYHQDWQVCYAWNNGDDQPPTRRHERGDIVPSEVEAEDLDAGMLKFPDYAERIPVVPEENYPDDLQDEKEYVEGAKKRIIVNAYERDPKARKACLKQHGYRCAVCTVDFQKVYGKIGKQFIHVHHKKPLAECSNDYIVKPTIDLVPVCPNCHAMLHTSNPPLGIAELKQRLDESAIGG